MRPDNCFACGRKWMFGEAMKLNMLRTVCPHAADCSEKRQRDKMVRDYKRWLAATKGRRR